MRAEMADDLTGQLLAERYRLDRLLAVGGMARVWAGTDLVLSRPVAIKVLHSHLAADHVFVERFRREAVAVARLNHPSIVAIYDTCSENGHEAIVMELVPGQTLRSRLDEAGALPMPEVLEIGAQVAAALGEAHEAGIIHRDIKPANILLTGPDGDGEHESGATRAFVTDFGIAKAMDAATADNADLTRTGAVLGTAKYVTPEQLEGRPVDARTDVYALGVVLYEALCGRAPWAADSEMSTALARLHHEPLRPRQIRADIPREVERVVLRAMARQPEDRYRSATDLRAALLAAERHVDHPSRAALSTDPTVESDGLSFVRSERSWLVPSAVVVVLALALVAGGLVVGRTSAGHGLVDRVFGGDADKATTTTAPTPPKPVAIQKVADMDPFGDGQEHPERLANVIDGDPATTWVTDRYRENLATKPGLGVAFDVARNSAIGTLRVISGRPGWAASVYVSDKSSNVSDLAGWGNPVAMFTANAPTTVVNLPKDTHGSSLLVWITSLGQPDTDGQYRVEIGEVGLEG
ncbi:MAG: eukaryotic-like serine/threonine-protein kinase [Acidimicrobiia bacterium]|jgi:serine/threonine-protein kinase|nr:eukaryotic-like serine/threonine-protein kinase [Acidimicrobiia bacterium]